LVPPEFVAPEFEDDDVVELEPDEELDPEVEVEVKPGSVLALFM